MVSPRSRHHADVARTIHSWPLFRFPEPLLLDRLRKQLDERGALEVLRRGIEVVDLRAPLLLAQFRSALGMNPEITARYAANRLRVIRQLR